MKTTPVTSDFRGRGGTLLGSSHVDACEESRNKTDGGNRQDQRPPTWIFGDKHQ